jgi:hypothetical protein
MVKENIYKPFSKANGVYDPAGLCRARRLARNGHVWPNPCARNPQTRPYGANQRLAGRISLIIISRTNAPFVFFVWFVVIFPFFLKWVGG